MVFFCFSERKDSKTCFRLTGTRTPTPVRDIKKREMQTEKTCSSICISQYHEKAIRLFPASALTALALSDESLARRTSVGGAACIVKA